MRILILEMGPTPEELKPKYDHYAPFFEELMADESFTFESLDIYAGDPLPPLDTADGYIFTGSKHGVYEKLPWMLEAEAFIRQAAQAKKPMVGICFGHQIMAQALGGEVIKSPKGWGLGVNEYEVIGHKNLKDLPKTMKFNAVHQDQVVKKPADAEVFAQSEFCEYAGLVYGTDKPYAISLQPHPEFSKEFTTDLIKTRRGDSFPEEESDAALATQSETINRDEWGRVLVNFIKSAAS